LNRTCCQTIAPDVCANGECAGGPQFTHVSFDDIRIVRDNLAGGDVPLATGGSLTACLPTRRWRGLARAKGRLRVRHNRVEARERRARPLLRRLADLLEAEPPLSGFEAEDTAHPRPLQTVSYATAGRAASWGLAGSGAIDPSFSGWCRPLLGIQAAGRLPLAVRDPGEPWRGLLAKVTERAAHPGAEVPAFGGQEALEVGSDTARTGGDIREPREASSDQDALA
jgi:hypothetical protein